MSKRSRGLFLGLLIGALALGGLGWVSNGFTNMDPKAWGDKFKPAVPDEEEPNPDDNSNILTVNFVKRFELSIYDLEFSDFVKDSLTNAGVTVDRYILTTEDYKVTLLQESGSTRNSLEDFVDFSAGPAGQSFQFHLYGDKTEELYTIVNNNFSKVQHMIGSHNGYHVQSSTMLQLVTLWAVEI